MSGLDDNVFWRALSGAQRQHTLGGDTARRLVPGSSSLVAFADRDHPDFDALAAHCRAGERFYVDGWTGAVPRGWSVVMEAELVRMALPRDAAAPPEPQLAFDTLGAADADAALALAEATRPGPFGPRTLELGEFIGVREAGTLVAMAGERLYTGSEREISGVCTLPAQRGRGLARQLMQALMRRQLARGERPFLHVMAGNTAALTLYAAMGFQVVWRGPMRIVERGA